MKRTESELGAPLRQLLPQQEAYRTGRLDWQKKQALANKEVRAFLAAHPEGSTKEEIRAACPLGGSTMNLARMGLAYFTGGGKNGSAKWFAKSM